jgi:hypothetical protein
MGWGRRTDLGRTDGRAGSPGGRAVIWGFGTTDGRIWAGRTEDLGRTDGRASSVVQSSGRAVIREGRRTTDGRPADRRT